MHNTPNPTNIKKSQRKGKVERLVVCIFAPRLSSRKKLKPRKSSATAGQTFPKITIIFALLSKRYFPWRNFFSLFPFWLCYKHYISSWSWTSFSLFYRRNLKKYRDDCDCIVSRYFFDVVCISNAMSYKDHVCFAIAFCDSARQSQQIKITPLVPLLWALVRMRWWKISADILEFVCGCGCTWRSKLCSTSIMIIIIICTLSAYNELPNRVDRLSCVYCCLLYMDEFEEKKRREK